MALYLGHLASTGRSIATVQQARSAISHFHAAAWITKGDKPARNPVVGEMLTGWRNQTPAPRQAGAPIAEAITRIREIACLPRRVHGGRAETPVVNVQEPGQILACQVPSVVLYRRHPASGQALGVAGRHAETGPPSRAHKPGNSAPAAERP